MRNATDISRFKANTAGEGIRFFRLSTVEAGRPIRFIAGKARSFPAVCSRKRQANRNNGNFQECQRF